MDRKGGALVECSHADRGFLPSALVPNTVSGRPQSKMVLAVDVAAAPCLVLPAPWYCPCDLPVNPSHALYPGRFRKVLTYHRG